MEQRTRTYLRGRFRDYYRDVDLEPPPAAYAREWGHIPWTAGDGTTMVRHQSLHELGNVETFLVEQAPRHVYFSGARYENPGSHSMEGKGWTGADLVFDLDADHLPSVDPETTRYAEMLAACKDALVRLLDLLETDLAFEDLQIVFSGGRGYHVHVRDPSVRDLDSDARREIVDYLRGVDLDPDALLEKRPNETGTLRETLRSEGGWGRRIHDELLELADELRSADETRALDRLQEFDGIGDRRAEKLLEAFRNNVEAIESGNMEAGTAKTLVKTLAPQVVAEQSAPIDEPVTTDVRRLIRLPGSLHGGSGLAVVRIDREDLAAFDPLRDAVPDRFTRREIAITVEGTHRIDLCGETTKVSDGKNVVRECVGVFLMARGHAEKAPE